ncbi:unnamed protein product, partial [Mesorhabditis belari]|uniref:Epoxide hydrolase n=1 Tax=Mesorhabditis belari TaxID=2138241 RepID=A0AAF3F4W1_9BILA
MGCCCCGKGGLLLLVLLAAVGVYLWTQPKQKIEISENGWYGKGKMGKDDETIKAFKINVPEEVLTDLKTRLSQARISHETLEDSDDFQYGFNSHYLKEVKDYWQNKYDWRKHEATLNAFTQFTTQIEGMKIHFIHSKPAAGYKKIYPLLIVHGWPGNVQEFVKIIPMLNDPKKFGFDYDFAFEVIAPSIPGYGFSECPKKTGFSQVECARVFHKLMNRLNFKKYYIQGGDWGSVVTSNMARMYKNEILALHLNMNSAFPSGIGLVKAVLGSFTPKLFFSSPNYQNFNLFDLKFTLDEVLTIVTIYWVQGNIVNSQRFYKEFFLDTRNDLLSKEYCEVPTAHSNFGHEPFDKIPEEIMKHSFNLQYRREHPDGGHFAAYELPKTLASDIFEFIRQQTTPKAKKTDEL